MQAAGFSFGPNELLIEPDALRLSPTPAGIRSLFHGGKIDSFSTDAHYLSLYELPAKNLSNN